LHSIFTKNCINVFIIHKHLEKCENKTSASIPTTSGDAGLDTYQTAGNICLAKDIIYVTTADLVELTPHCKTNIYDLPLMSTIV